MVKKRKISISIGSLIPGSLLLIGLAFILFGLLDGPSITGMIVSDGSYISPTSDSGYLSPTSDGGYKSPTSDSSYKTLTSDSNYTSPTSDASYKSPTSDSSYKTPTSDSSYKSPTTDSSYKTPTNDGTYKTPTSDGSYKSITTDSNYKSPTSDTSYKTPTTDSSYKSPTIDKGYKSSKSAGDFKSPKTDSSYLPPKIGSGFNISTGLGFTPLTSDGGAKSCSGDNDCVRGEEKCLNGICLIRARTGRDSQCSQGQHHYDPYGDGRGFCGECFSSSECPNKGSIFCENGYDSYFTCVDDMTCKKWKRDTTCADKGYEKPKTDNGYKKPESDAPKNLWDSLKDWTSSLFGNPTQTNETISLTLKENVSLDKPKLKDQTYYLLNIENPESLGIIFGTSDGNYDVYCGQHSVKNSASSSYSPSNCMNAFPAGSAVKLRGFGGGKNTLWDGDCTGLKNECSLVMDSNKHVRAASISDASKKHYILSIENPESLGIIFGTSDGNQDIYCGQHSVKNSASSSYSPSNCVNAFPAGSVVNLRGFSGGKKTLWGGDCSGIKNECSLVMDSNKHVMAASISDAGKQYYILSIENPESLGIIFGTSDGNTDIYCGRPTMQNSSSTKYSPSNCVNAFAAGSVIKLRGFGGGKNTLWDGDCTGLKNECSLVMDSNKNTMAAIVRKEQATESSLPVAEYVELKLVSVTENGSQGTITLSDKTKFDCKENGELEKNLPNKKEISFTKKECTANILKGTALTLSAAHGDKSEFKEWIGACNGAKNTCTIILDKNTGVTAIFSQSKGLLTSMVEWTGNLFAGKKQTSNYRIKSISSDTISTGSRNQIISSQETSYDYPTPCDDYPTMPGCPGEGTNIVQPPSTPISEVTFSSFEPKKAYPHAVVSLKGKNLGYVARVYFGGELVEGFSTTPDGTELQTIVPQDAKTGKISLLSTSGGAEYSDQDFIVWTGKCNNPDVTKAFKQLNKNPQGQKDEDDCDVKKYGAYSNYKELRNAIQKVVGFSKLSPATITSFRPSPTLPGSDVSIYGSSLDVKADDVQFDRTSIPFRLIDENEIKIKISQDAVFGEHEITIVSDIHGSGKAKLKIVPLPGINGFSPNKVFLNEEITLTGENFYEPEEISFFETDTKKEILTKNFKKESLQQIKVNAPLEPGSYIITVKAKNSFARTQTSLTVSSKALLPQITSIEPEDARLGNTAIVYGDNLKDIQSITLNGYRMRYTPDPSGKTVTLTKVLDEPLRWGIDQGVVKIKTSGGEAQAELISNKNPVTKLVTGKEETCFGGVGKGCYGSEDGKEEWGWGSQKIFVPVGCSQEVNGQRNCWTVPGSIKHDNCCARYPGGRMCGGPGKDGKPAGDDNHDGNCVDVWNDAVGDVTWWRAFVATYDVKTSTDLTPRASTRYTLTDKEAGNILSETDATLRLCAPGGHELREQKDEGFCCSGKAVNKKCTAATAKRGVQGLPEIAVIDNVKRTENGADLSTIKPPLAPGETATLVEEPKKTFYIRVQPNTGSIKSEDGTLNCPPTCKVDFAENKQIKLIASPKDKFEGWSGDLVGTTCFGSGVSQCTITMNNNKFVSASFKQEEVQKSYFVNINKAGSGNGGLFIWPNKPAQNNICDDGCTNEKIGWLEKTKFELKAVPKEGSIFSGWEGLCEDKAKDICIFTMPSKDNNLIAKFDKKGVIGGVIDLVDGLIGGEKFELEIEGAFSGSVKTADGKITNCRNQNKCKATYPKNTKVTLIATPDYADYENSGWFGDCANTPKTENCILTMDSNKKVILGFFAVAKPQPAPQPPPATNKTKGGRPGGGGWRKWIPRPVFG